MRLPFRTACLEHLHLPGPFLATLLCLQLPAAPPTSKAQPEGPRALRLQNRIRTGDLEAMIERRLIRVVAPYGRTLYFTDKGRERGIAAENIRDFERYLNKKYAQRLGKRPITVVIIPRTRDQLLTDVATGLGDIAAGDILATDSAQRTVDFVAPKNAANVREILLSGTEAPRIEHLEELSGKTVHVRKSSSYHEGLLALNERLKAAGRPPVNLVAIDEALEDEDLMEMVNAGLLTHVFINDWLARIWAPILPKVALRPEVALRTEGRIGWAIRKNSPGLRQELEEFYERHLRKQGVLEARLARYHKQIKQLSNSKRTQEWKRFEQAIVLFRKYGEQYRFDPLMLAAQGYQESGIDQSRRSPRGAVGVMQIMPATGKELRVGDIALMEPNIHAGAKYMDKLMSDFFPDAKFNEQDRSLFAFASYNAGPGNISKMRRLAENKGLDPNQWFNNVEVMVAARIGLETTTYVRNIFKYYVAYKLTLAHDEASDKARQQLEHQPAPTSR